LTFDSGLACKVVGRFDSQLEVDESVHVVIVETAFGSPEKLFQSSPKKLLKFSARILPRNPKSNSAPQPKIASAINRKKAFIIILKSFHHQQRKAPN
jgi:hypothetical protein